MSARHIKIELEIHAITCPGVWLCQNNGDIELTITALGYTFSGKPLKPRFPLCYHEKFVMDGYFSDISVTSLAELEKALDDEQINFTLWQKGRRLAFYLGKIGVILNYTGCMNNNFAITDNAIIMTRGSCFPGTISPKIEYTASIRYSNRCMKCNRHGHSQNEKRTYKNLYETGANLNLSHQKPVCHAHTKPRHRWRHIGTPKVLVQNLKSPTLRNEENENSENDLCDYFSLGSHALYATKNASGANEKQNVEVDATPPPRSCGHIGLDEFGEPVHSENKCKICVQYALLFDRSTEKINDF